MKVKSMTYIALFAALIAVLAPWSITVGAVPVTLATFAICLAASVLGWKMGAAAVAVYILIGAVGLPVFSNATGGLQKIMGATGGYIVGYIPLAIITGVFSERGKRLRSYLAGMALGTAALYILGTAWFCVLMGVDVGYAVGVCVLPFLPGDAVKMALAALLTVKLRPAVTRMMR